MITIKDTRCAGIDCNKRKQCLRYLDLKAADHGAPVAERVCDKNKDDKMIRRK